MKHIATLLIFSFTISAAQANFFNQLKESANQQAEEAQTSAMSAAAGAVGVDADTVKQAASMQSMLASALDTSKQLQSMLGSNPELQSLLTNSMTALAQKQDLIALTDLSKLTDAKLTTEQMNLAKSLRNDVEVLALKRQLPESGPVTSATQALQSGDYQSAISQLNSVMQSGSLTDAQKQLVSSIISEHTPAATEAAK
ncbi:hypothetical protein [Cerasicoccus frondis]|uniref:hypothetical protein n=1 Tax=Cerasicoccus frondis TaxID=490090 RepID=UPI0028526798|nr:hypothetical protein [Cerasicoccus frondis]